MRYLIYNGRVTPPGMRNTQAELIEAQRAGHGSVVLMLTSSGGDIETALGLMGTIRFLPLDVHIHAIGMCSSIAATIMLASERRSCDPTTQFLLHAVMFDSGPRAGQRNPITDLITAPFRDVLRWTDAEMEARFTATNFRFGASEAQRLGLVQQVEQRRMAAGDEVISIHIP